jgi:nicotinamidase-related amidase
MMQNTDDHAQKVLREAIQSVDRYYKQRGIFQDRFGFGARPAIIVVDFAYGWTDDRYAGGSRRLDEPIEYTRQLLELARYRQIPIIYTTSPYRPDGSDQPFKSAADFSSGFRKWDERACQIDERVAPHAKDLVIEKENASAFFGTHLTGYLVHHQVDTLLITGCSTSACIRATAIDAKSFRFRPIVVRECVGDRSAIAHVWTLFDIQSRFADVVSLDEASNYLRGGLGDDEFSA